jgi:hypothetical protein
MKSAYFTIHPGKNPPPPNGCRLKSVFFLILKAPVSHPPLSQFNRTFHKTNWPPLHSIPVIPGHCSVVCILRPKEKPRKWPKAELQQSWQPKRFVWEVPDTIPLYFTSIAQFSKCVGNGTYKWSG